ncbi:MAG: hypothetical protein LBI44_06365 [Oscillospiraceae bacterium]|nr:hypothetical protein [Oscillospiraceae bacterium]
MFSLIRAEVYRLLRKKSMYVYFCSLAAAYALIAFVRSGGFNAESIVGDAVNFLSLLPIVAGGFIFTAVYTDDLASRALPALIGSGMSRGGIVAAKLILAAMLGAFVFGLAPLVPYATHAALGFAASGAVMARIYAAALKFCLVTVGYCALSGAAVYGLQRATAAVVLYILLSLNVVGGLLAVLLRNALGEAAATAIASRTLSGITDRLLDALVGSASALPPLVEFTAYTAASVLLSAALFYKKELEF